MKPIPEQEKNALELLAHFRSAGTDGSIYSPSEASTRSYFDPTEDSYNTTPATSVSSLNASVPIVSNQQQFFPRLAQLPLVQSGIKAYEAGKNSSRVVQYMESSVQAISKPVLDRVVSNDLADSLDQFGCRQLDRFQTSPVASTSSLPVLDSANTTTADLSNGQLSSRPKTAFESVLIQASGLGLAISQESMKRLQYVLQWLGFATSNIAYQISLLRNLLASLQSSTSTSVASSSQMEQRQAEELNKIKSEIFTTVQKAIDVISVYAGAALPAQARAVVRATVLALPEKVARRQMEVVGSGPGLREAGEKVLGFAVEGVDVLSSCARVVHESIQTADAWLERMRILGLSRAEDQLVANSHQQLLDMTMQRNSP